MEGKVLLAQGAQLGTSSGLAVRVAEVGVQGSKELGVILVGNLKDIGHHYLGGGAFEAGEAVQHLLVIGGVPVCIGDKLDS